MTLQKLKRKQVFMSYFSQNYHFSLDVIQLTRETYVIPRYSKTKKVSELLEMSFKKSVNGIREIW